MSDIERFRRRLLTERQRLQSTLASGSDLALASEDRTDDDGASSTEGTRALSLRLQLQMSLRDIEHALDKFEAGTYARCDRCGQEIPSARLEIRPQAAVCVPCGSGQAVRSEM